MKLAIHGGSPVRTLPFPAHKTIDTVEEQAVLEVLGKGVLSKYLGAHHEDFNGGPQVRALETEWADYFGADHAISVNSNTSGLICAMGAIGIQPGDEVIVCAYSMSISATAPLFYGGVPVFADLEPEYFCLDPTSIEKCITQKTKAILIVDLFGQPYDAEAINDLANNHGLIVVEDCAQAPGATLSGRRAGTLGDIGVFSLNYHKHIHCGEGGVIVTDNEELAERMRLIRNHAESVVASNGCLDFTNMLGFNFRMTEIEAAIARKQLIKLDDLLQVRRRNVEYLESQLDFIGGLKFPKIREHAEHAYYQHALLWDENETQLNRDRFIDAVKAELPVFELRESEGVKIGFGYVKPLYRLPIFANNHYPSNFTQQLPDYSSVYCPVVEDLHCKRLIHHEFMVPSMTLSDLDDVVSAFSRVWTNRSSLN